MLHFPVSQLLLSFWLGLLLVLPIKAESKSGDSSKAELLTALERYSGTWSGNLYVRSSDGSIEQRLEIEQTYWWGNSDGVRFIKGQAVFTTPAGIGYSRSKTFIRDGSLFSLVVQDDKEQRFRGTLSEDGAAIHWAPLNSTEALGRLLKESFTEIDGREAIVIDGFETLRSGNRNIYLKIDATLLRDRADKAVEK